MINFGLAKEIYGNEPWMVDPDTFTSLFSILKDIKNGVSYNGDSPKMNTWGYYDINNLSFVSSDYDLRNATDNELINVINLDGVITKNGGASTNGTKKLSQQIITADKNERVKGHIIIADSGGGAGNAIQFMTDAMKSAKKPVVSFVEKGSIAASAAYGIISASDFIMSESKENRLGSLGTFIQFSGTKKDNTDTDGYRSVRIYATASTHKNFDFEEALNNGNFKPIIDNVLDPSNEIFLNNIKENRPNIQEDQMTGKMFRAGDIVGTMIDGIGTFNDAVNKILELSNINKSNKNEVNNFNLNDSEMTKQELKQNHPNLYQEIYNEGVMSERDRSGAWMAHVDTDTEAVKKGIESGEQISNSQREEFFVKQNAKNQLANMVDNSAADIDVDESASPSDLAEQAAQKEIDSAMNFELN